MILFSKANPQYCRPGHLAESVFQTLECGLLRTPLFYNLFISNLDLGHIIYPKYSDGVSVMKKNYGLDWLLFISGLICIVTGLIIPLLPYNPIKNF